MGQLATCNNAGKMPKDKVQKLEDTFFVWNALEAKSLERYEKLVQYVNEHGNASEVQELSSIGHLG